jgi:DNA-binding transcriptional regulator YhcF (GntR family)
MDPSVDNNQHIVTVRPGARKGWVVSVDTRDGDLPFSTRQLALEFARAYARLRRAGAVQIVNEKGILEHQERVQLAAERAPGS